MEFNKILKCNEEKQQSLLGQTFVWIFDAALCIYCLIQAAVFTNFCAAWMKVYLLPDSVGIINSPQLLQGEGAGIINSLRLLQGEDVGSLNSPQLLQGEGVGSLNSPQLLQGDGSWVLNSLVLLLGSWAAVTLYGAKRGSLKTAALEASREKGKAAAVLLLGVLGAEILLISEQNGIRAAAVALTDSQLPKLVQTEWDILFLFLYLNGILVNIAGALWCLRKKTADMLTRFWNSSGRKIDAEKGKDCKARKAEVEKAKICKARKPEGEEGKDCKARKPEGEEGKDCKATKTDAEKVKDRNVKKSGARMTQQQYANLVWAALLLLIYGMAVGFADSFCAMCYYRAMNIQLLLPVLLLSALLVRL